jgi:hypothetical protein
MEAGCRLRVLAIVDHEALQLVVDIAAEALLQLAEIDFAGAHDAGGIDVVDEGQEQMLQRGVFVLTLVSVGDGPMEGFF